MSEGQTGQPGDACPQCGSAAAVHSIGELVAQMQSRLNAGQQMGSQGGPGGQQQGPTPGWAQEPTAGPPGGYQGGGYQGGGYQGGGWQGDGWQGNRGYRENVPFGDDIAGLAMGAASRFIGRAIGRRVERAMTEKILPAMQARGQQALATQTAIAQRYPDLRACITDKVIFLAGGSRTAPMGNVNFSTFTLDQADALVASLRDG
jgi:hypothetical protein